MVRGLFLLSVHNWYMLWLHHDWTAQMPCCMGCQVQYWIDSQVLQNNAARVIMQLKRSDHISNVLMTLHWLPIKKRIVYKIALMTYKSLNNNTAPEYMKEMTIPYVPSRSLRSASQHQLRHPETKPKLKFYGKRSFAHAAPHIYNHLPTEIKLVKSSECFKVKLKSFLFRQTYL